MYWKNSFQSRNEFARIITPDGLVKSGPFKFLPVFHCSWSFQLLSTDYKKADLLKCTKMYTQNGPITNYLIYIHYIRQFFIKPYWFVISLKCKIALAFDLIAALSSARLVRVISAQLRYTANPNPVQLTAFPCKSIPSWKNLLSFQGISVLIASSLFWLQGFPCISLYFPVRDCSVL